MGYVAVVFLFDVCEECGVAEVGLATGAYEGTFLAFFGTVLHLSLLSINELLLVMIDGITYIILFINHPGKPISDWLG